MEYVYDVEYIFKKLFKNSKMMSLQVFYTKGSLKDIIGNLNVKFLN